MAQASSQSSRQEREPKKDIVKLVMGFLHPEGEPYFNRRWWALMFVMVLVVCLQVYRMCCTFSAW